MKTDLTETTCTVGQICENLMLVNRFHVNPQFQHDIPLVCCSYDCTLNNYILSTYGYPWGL
jgi:hypothetical protein